MDLSVIICTHNPRMPYLQRVITALREQNLPMQAWELVVVDNASSEPLAARLDLSWHPRARCLLEPELGLTPARLRGIRETEGSILVFVDDDNVLAPDYLARALSIGEQFPVLGAWGGQAFPEFESTPPAWMKPYLRHLALRQFDRDQWANLGYDDGTVPSGAGMVVRRNVALAYAAACQTQSNRKLLGRKGDNLTAFEDIDLACKSYEFGLGTGIFVALKLTHLISASRFQMDYLERLMEAMTYSDQLFRWIHRLPLQAIPRHPVRRALGKLRRRFTVAPLERRLWEAQARGRERATFEIQEKSGAASK